MNNNLLLRRYAVQLGNKQGLPASQLERPLPLHEVKNANVHPDVGKPIHSVIHNAMADAFHHLGLGKGSGEEQYQAFANLRDRANKELSNPNSKFTKLFNKHKSELSNVPNPREHLTDTLLPLFHNLSQYEEVPDKAHESSDLLGSGSHHPFESIEKDNFEYKSRLPSGFVQVPHDDFNPSDWSLEVPPEPKGKRKAYPNRNDIYKSIAEHEDMGWSAPNKLKDYLVQKHSITPQEAAVHISNFKRKKKKPTIPAPKETKRIWPPIQRKSRNTDLMAIPVRHSQNQQCHEITLSDDKLPTEEPIKNDAYRAPSKGIIVRGTQYKGGSFLPDLGGSFISPRRKSIK